MSATSQTTNRSTSNFTAIFDAASNRYKSLTGQDLRTHPFAAALNNSTSPDSILNVFRNQAEAYNKFHKGNDKLMAWLTPIVHILFTFSGSLGEGIGLPFSPAKTIFIGIGILLGAVKDVIAKYEMLVGIFERIQFFLQRLNHYTAVELTPEMTELLGKIMAQVLSILALSIKAMKERRIKMIFKRLLGNTDVEDALAQLDTLTKEENLMTVARTLQVTHHVDDNVTLIKGAVHNVDGDVKATKELTHHVDQNVLSIKQDISDVSGDVKETKELTHDVHKEMRVMKEGAQNIDHNVKVIKCAIDAQQRNQLRDKLRTWLTPPSPSINHNTACEIQHHGTAKWFIGSNTFGEWKKNESLLWISGNPGSGKTIICSAIIEDIKDMRESRSALVVYYYFDFKDAAKRDLRGLLASILLQLCDGSDDCWDIFSMFHARYRNGSEHPSNAALAQCLKTMLDLPGQDPVFIIIDALDECPNNTGTPSPREKVLDFVEDLVLSNRSNLFICITSRPEQDIKSILYPLTSALRQVSLHEEGGQKNDINSYIRSFVQSDRAMRRWRAEDRGLVIDVLSKRANGMFRWAYCQLDNLRRCMPSSIRKALDELPTTLDETYERTLEGIPKQKWQHAHRLFQCMVAAIRPLRVEELGELLAIEFGPDVAPTLMEGWRPENAEDAVLSACSTLISIINDDGDDGSDDDSNGDDDNDYEHSKIVQFSHFSVKEFLTSYRLQSSSIGNISQFYISSEPAHTTLARACLTVLLQLDEHVDKKRLETFPLAFYAAQHWVDHAKFFDVISQVEGAMEDLFNPKKSHFQSWLWVHNVEERHDTKTLDALSEHPSPLQTTPLYYAAFCGFSRLAKYLIDSHGEDVNAYCDDSTHGTPLAAASYGGHLDLARFLLDHGADTNGSSERENTPMRAAYAGGRPMAMRLLLEHGAYVDDQRGLEGLGTLLVSASWHGRVEFVDLLLQYNANVHVRGYMGRASLIWASYRGYHEIARLLLEHGADVNTQGDSPDTALHRAAKRGHFEFVRILLEHGADVHLRGFHGQTPFQVATAEGHHKIAQLLLEHGAEEE